MDVFSTISRPLRYAAMSLHPNPQLPFFLMKFVSKGTNHTPCHMQREYEDGKLNAVSLGMIHGSGTSTEEEINNEMKSVISGKRRELLRLVLQEKGSIVPRACKDVFWKMCKVVHLFYAKNDGFTSHEMANAVNAVIEGPILLPNEL